MINNITLKTTKYLNFSQLPFESHFLEFALPHSLCLEKMQLSHMNKMLSHTINWTSSWFFWSRRDTTYSSVFFISKLWSNTTSSAASGRIHINSENCNLGQTVCGNGLIEFQLISAFRYLLVCSTLSDVLLIRFS